MPRRRSRRRHHAHAARETATPEDFGPSASPDALLAQLSFDEIEETSGELHRRIGTALRLIGEERADAVAPGNRSPRWLAAELAATIELAAQTFAAAASGHEAPTSRVDRQSAMVSAVMYAAPTLPALLTRLEQDRRLLASLARTIEDGADAADVRQTPWGERRLREVLVEVAITAAARCALPLERIVALPD